MNKITGLLLVIFLISTNTLFAQGDIEIIEITEDTIPENIPFAIIEEVPVYPGCTGDNKELKQCMSKNISAFVNQNFNIKKASKGLPPGKHRVFVSFKINKRGRVTNIKGRSVNKQMEKVAIETIELLPKMKPGKQKGKKVGVLYSLPIIFTIK